MVSFNMVHLLGSVAKEPLIQKDEDGAFAYALAYLTVIRAKRQVGDGVSYTKCDHPVIMTQNPEIVEEISKWKVNHIIQLKGVIDIQTVKKTSHCPHCEEKNKKDGDLVFINPIHVLTVSKEKDDDAAMQYLIKNAEVSNQVYMAGNLSTDPKMIRPKSDMIVTQYQLAVFRRYRAGESGDANEPKVFPWVKAYGENARSDKERLHVNSKVMIDGFIQARSVKRHDECDYCKKKYDWADKAMEVVPYATNYIADYYSKEEVEGKKKKETDKVEEELFS